MRKLIFATLLIAATSGAAFAQNGGQSPDGNSDIPNMGRAPKQTDGVGRALQVVAANGAVTKYAYASGYLNSTTDALGRTTTVTRDVPGRAPEGGNP